MAGNIKGITIEFRGDTTRLDKALRQINNETKSLDKELRAVDKALKFNPTNVDLWKQKQQLLSQKIDETKEKLTLLKNEQARMDASGVDKNSAEYRKLQREIIETESKVKTFEGQLKKIGNVNLRAASEQFKEMGNKLTSAGQAMRGLSTAAAAVTAAIGALTVKSSKWADDLNTMSKQTGLGTKELQKYSAAADLVDVSVEAIAKSHTILKKNMFSARDGGASAEAFEELGVSVKNADGSLRDADEVWNEVIKVLGTMENETERDALAMKLMGKSASELNPLIEDGGETYKNVADTLKKYDLDFIDQETLDNANEFNDSLDMIKTVGSVAFQQLGTQLAAYLAPAMEKVVDVVGRLAKWFSDLSPETQALIAGIGAAVAVMAPLLIGLGKVSFAISSIMSLMATIGPAIGGVVAAIGPWVLAIGAAIAAGILLYKNWDKIKKFAKDFQKNLKKIWEDIKKSVTNSITSLKTSIVNAWNTIKQSVTSAVNVVKATVISVFNAVKTYISTVWNTIKTNISNAVTSIKTTVSTAFNNIRSAVYTAITTIQSNVSSVFTAIKSTVSSIWSSIKSIISTAINGAKTSVSTTVDAIETKVTSVFNAVKSNVSSVWASIKSAITTPFTEAKNTVSTLVSTIKKKIDGAFDGLADGVRTAFNKIKSAITEPFDTAKDLVSSAVKTIKGLFPISLGKIFSGVKLPHFKISGGQVPWGIGGKGTPPSVNIEWYKKGGIFDSPSVIGVGEAGSEAVVPLDKFWDKLDQMQMGQNIVININGANKDPREIAEEVKRVLIKETNQRRLAWQ